jgi:GNAT superfamily N-acetyltransferase
MGEVRLIAYNSTEYRQMVQLRDKLLRAPLGLDFSIAYLRRERFDTLIGYFEAGKHGEKDFLVGCCMLSRCKDKTMLQLRQMAVSEEFQGRGIGTRLLMFTEDKARKSGFYTLMMHARITAVKFYERLGYETCGPVFLEVGLPHREMRKNLQDKKQVKTAPRL